MNWKWNVAASVCVGAAAILLLMITGWGAYLDLTDIRNTFLRGEIGRLRSHAVRTVGRIQEELTAHGTDLKAAVNRDNWLRQYWTRWIPKDQTRVYAAVVDSGGTITLHSNPGQEGGWLDPAWYERTVPEAGDDVVKTSDVELAGSQRAFDVRVPILVHDHEVGSYHSGLSDAWFEKTLAEKQMPTKLRWGGIFAGILALGLVTAVSQHQIIKRTVYLRQAMELARVRQLAELGELAAGVAHEIRNPINAIRLNLHTIERMRQLAGGTVDGEATTILRETNEEIERIEKLMRLMLGYARPEKPVNEDLDVRGQLEATLHFLTPTMERDQVFVRAVLPPSPVFVCIDRNRLRQIMINLLNNAKDAVGVGGAVEVQLARRSGRVEIVVADSGPGVPPAQRERIFDPFYSTKELGTGLGLALVKRFTEEAEGTIACESNGDAGARFRLSFPEAPVHESEMPTLRGPRLEGTVVK